MNSYVTNYDIMCVFLDIKYLGVLSQDVQGGYRSMGGYKTPGFMVPGTVKSLPVLPVF